MRTIERGYDKTTADWVIEFDGENLDGDFAFEDGVMPGLRTDGESGMIHPTLGESKFVFAVEDED